MTKTIVGISAVLFSAMFALPFSHALAQKAQKTPTVRITSYLSGNETTTDRIPLPVGGFAALQDAIKYPEIASRIGLEGRVVAKATIDTLGNAKDVRLYYSDAEILGDALSKGLSSFRFNSALRRGRSVSSVVTVVAMFLLHDLPLPCSTDSSCIVELVLNHRNEDDHQADRTIVLRADGTATFDGYLSIEPIDTTSILSFIIRVPENYVHGVVGGFNPLDFEKLCALLNRLVDTQPPGFHRRVPSSVPYDVITIVTLDGKRRILTTLGEEPDIWSIARTIDCIAGQILWYESWSKSDKK